MLKKLNHYIVSNGYTDDISKYPDTKYIALTAKEKSKIINCVEKDLISPKKASACPANRMILDLSDAFIFINKEDVKENNVYKVYFLQKNHYKKYEKYAFICFYLDNNYQIEYEKHCLDKSSELMQEKIRENILALKGFMLAISS